jgi:glycolate oxidase iron-sulfur subunit
METNLADFIRDTPDGKRADAILRACVHCGFCTATCPTYQLLGDELDGPRGRIYLMKQVLEGAVPTAKTQLHLDRCLTCRACETTCPSGVRYGELLDIGRAVVDHAVARPLWPSLKRKLLCFVVPHASVFAMFLWLGRLLQPVLPLRLAAKIPAHREALPGVTPTSAAHPRRMLLLDGCAQPAISPQINAAAITLFSRLGIALTAAPNAGCCGALRFHLDATADALDDMRRNIDAWWPQIEAGCEAIVVTASGCSVMVKDYGRLLADDERYAAKAARVTELARDVVEVVAAERTALESLLAANKADRGGRLAFHPPCTLQHGMQIRGVAEDLLRLAGFELDAVADAHLCCGSAGTYSIMQPELSIKLRDNKLAALGADMPEAIATANIGCLAHLQSGTDLPVRHWVEFVEARCAASAAVR